jgi:WD40 repeat protein
MKRTLPLIGSLAIACSGGDQVPPRSSDGTTAAVDTASLERAPTPADVAAEAFRSALAQVSEALVRPLLGHAEDVTAVTVSPDGRWIASGSEDGSIFIWDAAIGTRVQELVGHNRAVTGLAVSPDGERLVSTSQDGTTRLWSLTEGRQERVLQEGVRYRGPVFGPVGRYNPNGSLLATGVSEDRATQLWHHVTGDSLGSMRHLSGGGEIAFLPDGLLMYMRLSNGVVAWNPRTHRAVWQLTGQYGGLSLAVDPTGTLLAYETRTHVAVVDVQGRGFGEGRLIDTLATGPVGHLEFTPTGELVMASGRTVRVWDVMTRTELASISGAMGQVSALALSPDGTLLVAGSRDGAVWLWDLPKARRASELGMMPWGVWDGPVPRGVGVHCDRRYGPGGVVAGVVMDSLDAVPVDSAQVSINGCNVETDQEGNFLFVGIDPGNHRLSAYKPGWQGRGAGIETIVGDTTRVTIRMSAKATCNPAAHPDLPRIESEGSVVWLRLDDALQAALDSIAPGFEPYGLETYANWIASGYSLQCYQAPSAVLGDFNGDGVSDLAAVGRSGDQEVDLVLLSSTDGYVVAREGRRNGVRGVGSSISYYVRQEPGEITSSWEPDSLVLTTHAVHDIIGEKASTLYYWLDGQWREYVTSD